jgi:predicted acylesterase/phospholipase RssA
MSNSSIADMAEFFTRTAHETFSETRAGYFLSKIDPSHSAAKALMFLRLYGSVFKQEPLEKALVRFFGREPSLFAPARKGHQQCTTRVAVTAAKDFGQTDCLIASYNRPLVDDRGNFEREEYESKDMKIWEAALATSAAPFYLPPFIKEETKTDYVDGAVYANCPAQVAYEETLKLWPDNGASLDFLLSFGTGSQKRKGDKTPTAVKFGGFAAIRAMFERQLDSQKSWEQFENGPAGSNVRCRLHRLDPPIDGDHVALYHHQKIPDLVEMVRKWTKTPEIAEKIQDIANILIANLFFFEPHEKTSSTSHSLLVDPSYNILAGSIRCRLGHDSVPLRNLLAEKVVSFWYTEASSADTENLKSLPEPRWTLIRDRIAVAPSQMTIEENQVKKFRLNHTFRVKHGSNLFQVLAVKLNGTDKRIAISGFPSTLADLQKRAKLKWLQ